MQFWKNVGYWKGSMGGAEFMWELVRTGYQRKKGRADSSEEKEIQDGHADWEQKEGQQWTLMKLIG